MNIFVAGASSQRYIADMVIQTIQFMGHEVFNWTQDIGYVNPRRFNPSLTAAKDKDAVFECDGLIWLAGDPSHGAPFEAGFAHGLGKPIVVLWLRQAKEDWIYTLDFPYADSVPDAIALLAKGLEL